MLPGRRVRRMTGRVAFAIVLLASVPTQAGVLPEPEEAPEWKISAWLNGDPGTLGQHRGRVVLIEFFQLWCPGCNAFSIPLFQRWHDRYGEREDVLVVSIHSVFEGHEYQSPDRLRRFVEDRGIRHPVGIDAFPTPDAETPETMERFDTDGTPHVFIVDKNGEIVFSHFGAFAVAPVEAFVDRLLREEVPLPRGPKARPVVRKDPELSGRYTLTFRQTEKSCGRPLSPLKVPVDLEVLEDEIQVRSPRGFMDYHELTAGYDARAGTFQSTLDRWERVGDAEVSVSLRLDGRFVAGTRPPEFEFRLTLDKSADRPGWDCHVEAEGEGRRSRRNPAIRRRVRDPRTPESAAPSAVGGGGS